MLERGLAEFHRLLVAAAAAAAVSNVLGLKLMVMTIHLIHNSTSSQPLILDAVSSYTLPHMMRIEDNPIECNASGMLVF